MARLFETTVEINAPAERIWSVMSDVERWHEWTASITSVQRMDAGPFGLGSRATVIQPRLAKAVWRVTQWEPGRGFVWEARSPGALVIGEHWVVPGENSSATSQPRNTAVLKVHQSGALIAIVGPFFAKLTRRYMHMEAQGLKRRCETA